MKEITLMTICVSCENIGYVKSQGAKNHDQRLNLKCSRCGYRAIIVPGQTLKAGPANT